MSLRKVFCLFLSVAAIPAGAQYPIAWSTYKDLAHDSREYAEKIINAPGGGYYFTAKNEGGGTILRKLDGTGGVVWTRVNPAGNEDLVADASGAVVSGGSVLAVKLDPSGNKLWSLPLPPGGSANNAQAALDAAGNIILSWARFRPGGSLPDEVALGKFDGATGAVLWKVGFSPGARLDDNRVDSSGNVYVLGHTSSTAFLSKYNAAGALQWTQTLAGVARGMEADANGNSYLLYTSNNTTTSSLILYKYDTVGNLLWYSPIGTSISGVASTAVHPSGGLFIVWEDGSANIQGKYVNTGGLIFGFSATPGRLSPGWGHLAIDSQSNMYVAATTQNQADALILKRPFNGEFTWSKVEDGSAHASDKGQSIVVDGADRAVLLSSVVNVAPTLEDSRVSVYDAAGTRIWAEDYELGMAADSARSSVTDGAGTTYVLSLWDLLRIDTNGKVSWVRPVSSVIGDLPMLPPQLAPNGNVVAAIRRDTATGAEGVMRTFDPAGNLLWQLDLTSPTQHLSDFRVAKDGAVYLAFTIWSSTEHWVRLVKLSASGAVLWTVNKPEHNEWSNQIVVDATGSAYVGFHSPSPGLAKYSSAGVFQWSRPLPPAGATQLARLRLDPAGNPLVATYYSNNLFLTKLDPVGNVQWSTEVLSGASVSEDESFAVDSLGNAFFADWTPETTVAAVRVQRISPTGAIDWTVDNPIKPTMGPGSLAADNGGGVVVYSNDGPVDRIFKVQANGVLAWPSSGGAFESRSIPAPSRMVIPHSADLLTFDSRGNLYLSGGGVGPSGTYDVQVTKYWANHSTFVSQTVPTSMVAGQTYTVSVTFKNTGFNTWTKGERYKLGVVGGAPIGVSEVLLNSAEAIGPGETRTFTFRVYAPVSAGTYNLQFKMYVKGVSFGAVSPVAPVTVAVRQHAARFMSQIVPTSVKAGSTFGVTVLMRNVGTNTWTQAGDYVLAPVAGYPAWGVSGVQLAPADSIAQGQDKTFTFTCTAPSTPGSYTMRWQMYRPSVGFFGDRSFTKTISVVP